MSADDGCATTGRPASHRLPEVVAHGRPADLVVTGADVWTGDATRSWSDAVAVRGTGSWRSAPRRPATSSGPRTRVIHAPGSMVVPGFQDAHVHAPFAGRNRLHVWLNDLTGRRAYLDRIADYARANPDEPWIVGRAAGRWSTSRAGLPVKEDLDAVVPDRPVFLMNRGVHVAWVNSRALELAGITAGTDDPADGRIERDPRTGDPTGALHEGAAYSFQDRHVPLPTRHDWERAILEAQGHLHSLGHHRLAGRVGDARHPGGLPEPRGGRAADRPRRRRALVGPAPRAGPGHRLPHPA